MSVRAPAPPGKPKLVHPKHVQQWAHRQKTILRNTYDQAWAQGVNGYISAYGPDLSTADATDPVTGLAPGDDGEGDFADSPPDTSQQPAQQQDSWLHQQLIDQITPTGRTKDKFTPTGRAEDKLIDVLKDRLLPDPIRRALALHPSLSSVNNMAGNMLGLYKTGTPEGDRQALLDYIDSNSWRIDPGESVAWAGEQNGYAEAAATDNQLLEWQTADDDRVCFPSGTMVLTPTGEQAIETLCPGDCVISHMGRVRRVLRRLERRYVGRLLTVETGRRRVRCTPNHPFLVRREGELQWARADSLAPGEYVVTQQGECVGRVDLRDAHHVKAALDQVGVLAGVGAGSPVPIGTIDFDRQVFTYEEVHRVAPDCDFSLEGNPSTLQCLPNDSLGSRLAGEASPACPIAEHVAVGNRGQDAQLRGAGGAAAINGRAIALLPTIWAVASYGLAAALAWMCGDRPTGTAGGRTVFALGRSGSTNLKRLAARRASQRHNQQPTSARRRAESSRASHWGPTAFALTLWSRLTRATLGVGVGALPEAVAGHPAEALGRIGVWQRERGAALVARLFLRSLPQSWSLARTGPRAVAPRRLLPASEGVSADFADALHPDSIPTTTVYNLEVEDDHSYVANGFVVHNCSDCEALGQFPPQPRSDWPSQPGDGSTQCNVGCRCSFEVSPIEIQPGDIYTPELSAAQHDLVNQLLDKQAQTLADSATEAAYLDGTTMQESSAWRMAEYSDDEPRDYHGRWTSGGGGDDSEAALMTQPGLAAPSAGSWSSDDIHQAQEALTAAVSRYPELSNGPHPYAGIGFTSSKTPPPGVSQGQWDQVRAATIQSGADGMTAGLAAGDRTYTAINDTQPFVIGSPGGTMPSDNTPYGTAMHEIGHAWAAANGYDTAPEIAGAMTAARIGPRDILNAGSRYGAADAREGFAELFSQANTPGYYLPRFLGDRFDNLMGIMRGGGFEGTDYSGSALLQRRPLVKGVGPLTPHIEASADRNLRANAWVSYVPELMRESVGRLREYSDDEARDDRGRWTSGGGSDSATSPADSIVGQPGPSAPTSTLADVLSGKAQRLGSSDGAQWSRDQYAQVHQAVNDAIRNHPELAPSRFGRNGLQGVVFLSQPEAPPGFTADEWAGRASMVGDSLAVTYAEPEWNGSRIVINDTKAYNGYASAMSGLLAESDATAYGGTMHEIGHAWAISHGVVTDGGPQLLSHGITPDDMAHVSTYAAANGDEGLAELFSLANTPGYSVPSDLTPRWDALVKDVQAQGTPPIPTNFAFLRPLLPTDPAVLAELQQAAEVNIKAGAWIAPTPLYDRLRFGAMRESTARLREYSDDEPRDYHGRWSSGGGGGAADLWQAPTGLAAKIVTAPDTSGGSMAQPKWTAADYARVGEAVNATLAKNPELATGPNPLKSVSFMSSDTPPAGMSEQEWTRARDTLYQLDAPGITYATPEWGGSRIIVNDAIPFPKYGTGENPAGWSVVHDAGDMVTHEIGHSWAYAHGINDSTDATNISGTELSKFGLSPRSLADFSQYAAGSNPNESLAELFAGANIAGRLPSNLAGQWSQLYQDVEAHGFPPIADSPSGSARPIVVTKPEIIAELQHAAALNARADDWVTPTPLYNAMLKRGRMREAYSPDEPRDDHGRWTGGGDSGSSVIDAAKAGGGTINPTTGEQPSTGFAVAIEGHSSITPDAQFFAGPKGQEAGRQITRDWLRQNAAVFDNPAMHIGVWHDTDHHEIVLDPSEVVPAGERDRAVALGVQRNQQAIYDIGQGAEISTGGTGGR